MPVYIGIDWSETCHDLCVMNAAGAPIAQLSISHTAEGFHKLEVLRQRLGVTTTECLVGLETAHTLLLDFLWAHGYSEVYVIPPSVVKSTRGRYRQRGARSDQSDAFLLANLLRTDRARLQPWHPDSVLTRQLRARVSLLVHLTHSSVRLSNRLRAVLLRYYPAALHVFSHLDTQIALHFIQAYPTPQAAAGLSFSAFKAFAAAQQYRNPAKLPACYARLQQAYPVADPSTICIYQDEAVQLATLLLTMVRAKHGTLGDVRRLFRQHPDAPIFASLPGTGDILGPGLLVKFGDDRQRFPLPASVQALAGTCPVTEKSGKKRVIKFRRACDHEFRSLAHSWAVASLRQSAWAYAYWERARSRGVSDTQAYRCLANRWLAIAWKLWQTRQLYDEGYHMQQRMGHSKRAV